MRLTQWFSYRKKNRERPIMGDRRPPSKLGDIQPDHWLAEYTTELLSVLHVLALLVEKEPDQAASSRELQETIRRVREKCIAEGTWDNGTVIRLGPLPEVPRRVRKSLRNKPEKRLPLFDDHDTAATKQEPSPGDADRDEISEELP